MPRRKNGEEGSENGDQESSKEGDEEEGREEEGREEKGRKEGRRQEGREEALSAILRKKGGSKDPPFSLYKATKQPNRPIRAAAHSHPISSPRPTRIPCQYDRQVQVCQARPYRLQHCQTPYTGYRDVAAANE